MRTKREAMRDLGRVLRRKIIIQKIETIEDEIGQVKKEWVDWRTVWAERSNLWGQDYYAAATTGEENTIAFTLRHASLIDSLNSAEYRIKYKDKHYDIKHIDYLQDDGMWVKIKALERDAGG